MLFRGGSGRYSRGRRRPVPLSPPGGEADVLPASVQRKISGRRDVRGFPGLTGTDAAEGEEESAWGARGTRKRQSTLTSATEGSMTTRTLVTSSPPGGKEGREDIMDCSKDGVRRQSFGHRRCAGVVREVLSMWGKGTDSRLRSRIEWLELLLPRRSSRAGLFLEMKCD